MRKFKVEWTPVPGSAKVRSRNFDITVPLPAFDEEAWENAHEEWLYHAHAGQPCALLEVGEDGRRKMCCSRDWDEGCEFDHRKHLWRLTTQRARMREPLEETFQCPRWQAQERLEAAKSKCDNVMGPVLEVVY